MSEVGVFAGLSVEDNLRACGRGDAAPSLGSSRVGQPPGVRTRLSSREMKAALARTWEAFPVLAQRRRAAAGSLSGGQRKLLGLAKGLFRRPRLLILDEPSAGLAPVVVNEMVATLAAVRSTEGVTLLLAEQSARALDLANRVAVLHGGRKGFDGSIEEFRAEADITAEFFSLPSAGVEGAP